LRDLTAFLLSLSLCHPDHVAFPGKPCRISYEKNTDAPPQKHPTVFRHKRVEDPAVANLRKVLALTSVLNSTLRLNELLALIMKTLFRGHALEVASLLLIDEGSNELVFRVALAAKAAELEEKFRVKIGEGIAGSVAASENRDRE